MKATLTTLVLPLLLLTMLACDAAARNEPREDIAGQIVRSADASIGTIAMPAANTAGGPAPDHCQAPEVDKKQATTMETAIAHEVVRLLESGKSIAEAEAELRSLFPNASTDQLAAGLRLALELILRGIGMEGKKTGPVTPLNPALLKKIDEIGLSEGTANTLKRYMNYVGELVQLTEGEVRRTLHYHMHEHGDLQTKKVNDALYEIRSVLAGMGLHLQMEVTNWPPENLGR